MTKNQQNTDETTTASPTPLQRDPRDDRWSGLHSDCSIQLSVATASQPLAPPVSEDLPDPEDAFEEVIEKDPEICMTCFTRYREWIEHSHMLLHDEELPTEDGSYNEHVTEHDEYGAIRTHRPRTTCENCGAVGGGPPDRARSRREALQVVPALADRLKEAGYDKCENTLRYAIRELKSRPEIQRDDDREIYRRAVKVALKHA